MGLAKRSGVSIGDKAGGYGSQSASGVARFDRLMAEPLLQPDAVWSTAFPLGEARGGAAIAALIGTRPPPRQYGDLFFRHRMERPADSDDLAVLAPGGERRRFSVGLDTVADAGHSRTVIKELARTLL